MNFDRPARYQSLDLAKPESGRLDVTTTLADFAIITYAVDPESLRKHLAPGVEPEIFTLSDGRRVAFISAVPFRDLDFRFNSVPWFKFSFGQTNYRAYVLYGGERAVWFFGTSLATPFVLIPRYLWKLPWHHARMRFSTEWDGERSLRYNLETEAEWGRASFDIEGTDQPAGALDGFLDEEETAVVLTHPLKGYYFRRDDKIGTYSVWHDRLKLKRGILRRARFYLFEDLGLITGSDKPHSILLQRQTEFTISLPPYAI